MGTYFTKSHCGSVFCVVFFIRDSEAGVVYQIEFYSKDKLRVKEILSKISQFKNYKCMGKTIEY